MITIDDGKRVHQHRKGETKTKQIGRILHNPHVNGPAEKREPFIYIAGACLTAGDCKEIGDYLQYLGSKQKFHDEGKHREAGDTVYALGKFIVDNLK